MSYWGQTSSIQALKTEYKIKHVTASQFEGEVKAIEVWGLRLILVVQSQFVKFCSLTKQIMIKSKVKNWQRNQLVTEFWALHIVMHNKCIPKHAKDMQNSQYSDTVVKWHKQQKDKVPQWNKDEHGLQFFYLGSEESKWQKEDSNLKMGSFPQFG